MCTRHYSSGFLLLPLTFTLELNKWCVFPHQFRSSNECVCYASVLCSIFPNGILAYALLRPPVLFLESTCALDPKTPNTHVALLVCLFVCFRKSKSEYTRDFCSN